MLLNNVVASFPNFFQATKVKGSDRARYGVQVLIPPDHPQLGEVWNEFEAVKNAGFPSGLGNRATVCFGLYEEQVNTGKDYYDPRFNGWYQLSLYSPGDKPRPAVVQEMPNGSLEAVMDPAKGFSGELIHVHFNMYTFTEGNTGVAGGLNGVCLTGKEGPMGRLDNRPTAEQMFGKPVSGGTSPGTSQRNGPSGPPADVAARQGGGPPPPRRAAPPAPPAAKKMTPKAIALGYTYDSLKQAQWTDQDMIDEGMLVPPAGVTPSFQ